MKQKLVKIGMGSAALATVGALFDCLYASSHYVEYGSIHIMGASFFLALFGITSIGAALVVK